MEAKATYAPWKKVPPKLFSTVGALLCRRAITFGAAALFIASGGIAAKAAAEQQDTGWIKFSQAEALQGRPVEFQGTVLCYDTGWGQLYIQDGANTIYLSPRVFTNGFEVGQTVAIKGETTWDDTGSTLTNVSAVVMGVQPLPKAARVKLADLGQSFGQWVETVGEVRVAEASRDRVTLILSDGHQKCLVYVMQTSVRTAFKHLDDCWVRIEGVDASRMLNGQLDKAILFTPGMSQIHVITHSQTDRWKLPVTAIDTLLAQPKGDWTNQPVHINGLVSAYESGSTVTIKDPTGVLNAEVIQVDPALVYQRVDAWGFLTIRTNQIVLSDAYFEISTGSPKGEPSGPKTTRDAKNQPTLTTVRQIRALSQEKANENLPARIHGVLTCVDLEWRLVFLQDGQDAIFLDTAQGDLKTGQWVEVSGQTDGSGFAPELISCSTRILGETNEPAPLKVDLLDVASGQMDSHWVEMEGVVRRLSKRAHHITLTMASPNGTFTAIVQDLSPDAAPAGLVDAFISLRGACGSVVNSRGQMSGVTLHVPSRKEITIIDPSPSNPFAIPPTPISNVATYNSKRLAGRRVKVAGVVTFVASDAAFFLQDSSGGLRIQSPQECQVKVGEKIEALGFPALSEFSPCLDEAVIRHVDFGPLPKATRTTAAEILQSGNQDGSMVEVEGTVLQSLSAAIQGKLVLQDGPFIFTAQFGQFGVQHAIPALSAGSRIRVRGVCAIQGDENNEPATFHIMLADRKAIVLIKGAPWWTPRHTLILAGGILFGSLLASGWVMSLRRRVRSQTEIILRNQKELIETSRRAGQADVATSVLHNVGNVLNSINVSATIVEDRVRNSRVSDISRVVTLIEDHSKDRVAFWTNDPRGLKVPEYLDQLAKRLGSEKAEMLDEVSSLRKNVEHVKEIIAMQQSYARVSGVFETVEVTELLEDTLRMNAESLRRHGVEVAREFGPLPPICTDKHKVLQILINLMRNAKYACDDSGRAEKQVILRATDANGAVKIEVADNGIGIPPENMLRIFNHGFTTRKEGHGFGLHSGALAAKELGGSLTVHSEGWGRGAIFTLTLPCQRPKSIRPSSNGGAAPPELRQKSRVLLSIESSG